MHPIPDTRFEIRRTAIWHANRNWILVSVGAVALLVLPAGLASTAPQLAGMLLFAATAIVAVTVGRIVRALNSLYRCPSCGVLPYHTVSDYKCGGLGPTRADFMSPTRCPHCGTRLR